MLLGFLPVYATSQDDNSIDYSTDTIEMEVDESQTTTDDTNKEPTGNETLEDIVDRQTEDVTIDEVEKWAERKGFEVVGLLQKFGQPFAIIIFILSAFATLLGALGNSRLSGKGLWGMAISMIIYGGVMYAGDILDIFIQWLST